MPRYPHPLDNVALWLLSKFPLMAIDPAARDAISALAQRSDAWKRARKHRLTGSNFGAAAGHNPYTSPHRLAADMLWGTFQGNEATRWGNDHEDTACRTYEIWLRQPEPLPGGAEGTLLGPDPDAEGTSLVPDLPHEGTSLVPDLPHEGTSLVPDLPHEGHRGRDALPWVEHAGLCVNREHPWLAVSPDGLVHQGEHLWLLEIKCPFKKQHYDADVGGIPPYYFDQIQGAMHCLDLPFCDFVVWTPHSIECTRFERDPVYWRDVLFPALKTFYFDIYLPMAVRHELGLPRLNRADPALASAFSFGASSSSSSRKRPCFHMSMADDHTDGKTKPKDSKSAQQSFQF